MEDYELSMVEKKYQVAVGEQLYPLCERMDGQLPLVQGEKSNLLLRINLEEMLGNLLNCVDLLDIVYCSVSGLGELPSGVSRLQTDLLRDVTDSGLVMQKFVRNTEQVLDELIEVYPSLADQDYQEALEILAGIKGYAVKMYEEAAALRDRFVERCSLADEVLQNALNKNSEFYDQKDKVQDEIANMNAELEALEALKEILQEQIDEMNDEYKELEKKEADAAKKAYNLELTGAIVGGIGELVTSIIPIKDLVSGIAGGGQAQDAGQENAGEQPAAEVSEQEAKSNPKVQQKDSEKKELEEKKKKLESEKNEIQSRLKGIDKEGDSARYEKLRTELEEKQAELDDIEGKIKEKQIASEKIKESLKNIGSGFSKAAQTQQHTVEEYNKRLGEIYKLRREIKKQDAENKGKIKRYTELIASSVIKKDSLNITIQSLTMAIGSLRKVVVILNEAALFWKSIAACCEVLSESNLADKIEAGMNKEADEKEGESIRPFYEKRLFVKTFLTYMLRWTALNLISVDYVAAMNKVRESLGKTIGRMEGDREEQWAKASKLAQNLRVQC